MSRLNRQSFLGNDSTNRLMRATIGLIGLGGGGSHLAQQCAHVGVGRYVPVDFDIITLSNTNRLVGGTLRDVARERAKLDIAQRIIRGLVPNARIRPIADRWQANLPRLRECDILVGAVDSFKERAELERFARRSLIPYVDIGMDVHDCKQHGFLISGQVFLSMPRYPCMRCCRILTDERLRREAEDYGGAGPRPQVVWPNGVLASTAMGLVVQLISPWYPNPKPFVFLEYDGNLGTLVQSAYMHLLASASSCPHHPDTEVGDPFFDIRSVSKRKTDDPHESVRSPRVSSQVEGSVY
jgi:molybdopterin-synthase adenylyltransferase